MRAYTLNDIPWLAGLLEGEGSFEWRSDQRPGRIRYGWPVVALASTDEDIVRRAATLMGAKSITRYKGNNLGKKPIHKAIVYGMNAADVMQAILPYMGVRRSEKIKEHLKKWAERPECRKRRKTCELLSYLLSHPGYSVALQ